MIMDNRMDLRSLETDAIVRKDDAAGAEGVGTELQDIVKQMGWASDRVKRQSQDSYPDITQAIAPPLCGIQMPSVKGIHVTFRARAK